MPSDSSTVRATPSLAGLRVLSFESRRAKEVATLIETFGGKPLLAPALREVPLESNAEAVDFIERLLRDEFDMTICLTGVGTRELIRIAELAHPRDAVVAALSRTKVVARGPKPLAVLREWQVPVWALAPEPNTWRDLLAAIEAKASERPIRGARIAVQEYGVSNADLLDALRNRGALVTRVPVYRWALPEDLEPLRSAVAATATGMVDVAMFTTSIQLVHFWQITQEMEREELVRRGLAQAVIASIGPTTSEELRRHGLTVDLEASHPKFGSLIRDLAEQAAGLLQLKRGTA